MHAYIHLFEADHKMRQEPEHGKTDRHTNTKIIQHREKQKLTTARSANITSLYGTMCFTRILSHVFKFPCLNLYLII